MNNMKKNNVTLLLTAFILTAYTGYAQTPPSGLGRILDDRKEPPAVDFTKTLNAAAQAIKKQDWEEAYRLYKEVQRLDGDVTAGYNAFIKQAKTFKISEGDCDDDAIKYLTYARNLKKTIEVRELLRICGDLKTTSDNIPIRAHSTNLVSDTILSFDTDGGTKTVLVYTNDLTFTVSSKQAWCSAIAEKSTKSDDFSKLIITCEANVSSIERTGSLLVDAEGKQVIINVTQTAGKLDESWRTLVRYAMNLNPTYPTFDNGDCYKGEKNTGGINGLGAYHWNNGKFYFGEWNQNRKNGDGIYIYKDFDTEDIDCNCYNCKIFVGGY
jgi:hypothetical protein